MITSLFSRKKDTAISHGLFKTRLSLKEHLIRLFKKGKIELDILSELEEILILADVGTKITMEVLEALRDSIVKKALDERDEVILHLKEELMKSFLKSGRSLVLSPAPAVFLFAGVNGSGKTTSIAKLAHRFIKNNKKVLLAAGDTFRAAAIEQLEYWGRELHIDVIRHDYGGDSAAVAYDAVCSAKSKAADCLLIDTAGRLQTKVNLMEELKKMVRAISKALPCAPGEKILVLDATFGQNAISQGKLFHEAIGLTGILLAKMDGSAKGGAILSIERDIGVPVKLVGIGEGIDDIIDFSPQEYLDSLLSVE